MAKVGHFYMAIDKIRLVDHARAPDAPGWRFFASLTVPRYDLSEALAKRQEHLNVGNCGSFSHTRRT